MLESKIMSSYKFKLNPSKFKGTTNSSLPYIIFGGVSIASGVLTLFLPETKGYEMPATVQDAIKLEE